MNAVIFDMDGVVVQTKKYIIDAWHTVLKTHGATYTEQDYEQERALALPDRLKCINARYQLSLDIELVRRKIYALQFNAMEKTLHAEPGLVTFLLQLKEQNIPFCLATSSGKQRTEHILQITDLKQYFSTCITEETVHAHKPDPAPFLEAAKQLDVNPATCVVIEDAKAGITAAKRAGMRAIGYAATQNKKHLDDADLVVNSFAELSAETISNLSRP